jgi:hypothetical protein
MPEPIVTTPPPAPDPSPAAPAFLAKIPESFRDRPWAKENAKDPETFFKFVDNQNSLVGKKGVIVPEDGAPVEQVNAFLKTLGRPDSPDGYEFQPIEELKDGKRDEVFEKDVKKVLHDAGIPKSMAVKLQQGFDKLMFSKNKEQVEKDKTDDAAFDKFNKDFFGEAKDTVVANARKILKETLPKEVLPALDKMNAEQMAMVIAVTDSVYKKFGKEDGFRGGAPGTPSGAESFDELSSQQRELMKQEGYSDWRHPNHAGLMEKNKVILEKMRVIKK